MLTSPWPGEVYWKERQLGGCLDIVFESGMDKVPGYWHRFKQLAGDNGLATGSLGLYIQPRQRARVCHVEFNIPCDPQSAGIEKVKAFHKRASESVMNAGAFFYRPYYDWADMIYSRSGYTFETIKKLKKIVDPNRTLNPGRINL